MRVTACPACNFLTRLKPVACAKKHNGSALKRDRSGLRAFFGYQRQWNKGTTLACTANCNVSWFGSWGLDGLLEGTPGL